MSKLTASSRSLPVIVFAILFAACGNDSGDDTGSLGSCRSDADCSDSGGSDAGGAGGSPGAGGVTGGGGVSGAGGITGAGGISGDGGVAAGGSPGDAGSDRDASSDGAANCTPFTAVDAGAPCSLDLCTTPDGYEIRVTRADGWYVGALLWVLTVCTESYTMSHYPAGALQTLAYPITDAEFAALPKDATVYVYYGGPPQDPPNPNLSAVDCGTLDSRLSVPQPIGACSN